MSLTEKQISDLIQMRHALHRQPDLSGDEAGTAASIVSYLQAFEPDGLICDLVARALPQYSTAEERVKQ